MVVASPISLDGLEIFDNCRDLRTNPAPSIWNDSHEAPSPVLLPFALKHCAEQSTRWSLASSVNALKTCSAAHALDDTTAHLNSATCLAYAGPRAATPAASATPRGRKLARAACARPLVAWAITVKIAGNLSAHGDAQKSSPAGQASRAVR
jgi:hypothetical protein